MMAFALKEAKNVFLDQTSIYADNAAFHKTLEWMDTLPTEQEAAGMKRLLATKTLWLNPLGAMLSRFR